SFQPARPWPRPLPPSACRPRSAAWPWRSTPRSFRAPAGRTRPWARGRASRSCGPPREAEVDDSLVVAGRGLSSRLILGRGGCGPLERLEAPLPARGAETVTVALRRVERAPGGLYAAIERAGCHVLPNTAGCFTARDAVATARLAREALETDWVKLEVIG